MQVVEQVLESWDDKNSTVKFDSIASIIDDYKQGKMVIILDDEDRENEGDLLIAAEAVSADDINFMAKYGRGLICLTLTEQKCQQLNLPLMVSNKTANNSPFGTRFTVSVEAAQGVTTGISAADRATTIKACIQLNANSNDIVQPGHIFPIMAQPGGVLVRAGHTESGCDLARLAGFREPASVLVEILNEDGTMARRDDLFRFAKKHGLKIGTVADLIKYRLKHEKTLEQVLTTKWPTRYGEFELKCFIDHITDTTHYALVKGDIAADDLPYVRVHVENKTTDLLYYSNKEENKLVASGWPLDESMEYISKQKSGVIVIISNDYNSKDMLNIISNKLKANLHHNKAKNILDKTTEQKILRRIGIGSQILQELGVTKMNLLSEPVRYSGLSGFNLEIVNFIRYEK